MKELIFKDLRIYLRNPFLYILLAVFTFVCGFIFLSIVNEYETAPTELEAVSFVALGFFMNVNFVLIFLAPVLTLNSFIFEAKGDMPENLRLLNISGWSFVGSKMFSLLVLSIIFILPLVITALFIKTSGIEESIYLFSGIMGNILNFMIYLSSGVFIHLLFFNSLALSIFLHLFLLLGINLIHNLTIFTDNFLLHQIFRFFSIIPHELKIFRGVFTLADLSFYFCAIFIGLYFAQVAYKVRWK
jgi:hypothetical protein